MENERRAAIAKDLLSLILGFFPRVDTKASVILGVDTAMLALLGITAPPLREFEWGMVFAVIPVGLIIVSLAFLYLQLFPHLQGGKQSLIYANQQ